MQDSSHVLMGYASQSDGSVTMTMIVVMAAMNWKVCVVSTLITVLKSDTELCSASSVVDHTKLLT